MNRQEKIAVLREFPAKLETFVAELSEVDLSTPYLAGEWTVAQNVHHLADSHMNSYIRFRLIMTEDHPTLKPYDQAVWATLPDADAVDLSPSLAILRGLHARWVIFLENLSEEQWTRTGFHPEDGVVSLNDLLDIYAQHCFDHLDQMQRTLDAKNTPS
jgi:hypothetical protein